MWTRGNSDDEECDGEVLHIWDATKERLEDSLSCDSHILLRVSAAGGIRRALLGEKIEDSHDKFLII